MPLKKSNIVGVVLLASVVPLAGCLASKDGRSALDSVEVGMTEEEVQHRVGPPRKILADLNGRPEPDLPGQAGPCWLYPKADGNWRYFCFDADQRVARIIDSVSIGGFVGRGRVPGPAARD